MLLSLQHDSDHSITAYSAPLTSPLCGEPLVWFEGKSSCPPPSHPPALHDGPLGSLFSMGVVSAAQSQLVG